MHKFAETGGLLFLNYKSYAVVVEQVCTSADFDCSYCGVSLWLLRIAFLPLRRRVGKSMYQFWLHSLCFAHCLLTTTSFSSADLAWVWLWPCVATCGRLQPSGATALPKAIRALRRQPHHRAYTPPAAPWTRHSSASPPSRSPRRRSTQLRLQLWL